MSQNQYLSSLKSFLKSFSSLMSYAKQVESESTMKIVGVNETSLVFTVQCKFRNIEFHSTANELIEEDLLLCFDKSDIAVISYYKGLQEERKKDASLSVNSVDHVTDENAQQAIFTCCDNKESFSFRKTARELINDMELIGQFDTKDIVKISYIAGREEAI